MNKVALIITILFLNTSSFAVHEHDSISRQSSKKRLIILTAGVNTAYIGSMIALSHLWYSNYSRSNFHFFNDNNEWMQMDKVGHFTTSFHESVFGVHALRWTGINGKKAMIYGSLAGFIYQTPIEYFDGRSKEYGASWGDILANASGSGLVLGQYLLWNEIRIQPKFSFHQTSFPEQRYKVTGSNALGNSFTEQMLKDYNGQTYWLSMNISSFIKKEDSRFPRWLNLALGYGANNMIFGTKELNNLKGFRPYRQCYLSLDIDVSHVKTKKKWLKYLLYPLNIIHIPFPAVELNKHKIIFHPLYF
jgi:hypothetical protein